MVNIFEITVGSFSATLNKRVLKHEFFEKDLLVLLSLMDSYKPFILKKYNY